MENHRSTDGIFLSGFLFILCLVASAPAWYLAKYQVLHLGVASEYAVGMRMLLGGLFLGLCYKLSPEPVPSTGTKKASWILICAQGVTLYAINFWFAYESSNYLVSGLIAVAFCAMILPNLILGKIFLNTKITVNSVLGAVIGLVGIILCFINDVSQISLLDEGFIFGSVLVFTGVFFSVSGTILTGKLANCGLSALYISSRGMVIAGLSSCFYAFMLNKNLPFVFDSIEFWFSLLYLALIVTTISNVLYIRLVRSFGAGNASFLWLCIPVASLTFSTYFEGYEWTLATTIGINLILVGGLLLNKKIWKWLKSLTENYKNVANLQKSVKG